MSKYTLLKKISVKTVCGKPKPPEDSKIGWLMEVFGVANDIKRGTSDKGDWYGFVGAFQALDMATGTVYRSGMLFIPDIAGGLMLPQLLDENNKSVEFGFRIGIKKDESSAVGYVYTAEPLLAVNENDPIELLAHKMKGAKQLAAPVAENAPAEPVEKKEAKKK